MATSLSRVCRANPILPGPLAPPYSHSPPPLTLPNRNLMAYLKFRHCLGSTDLVEAAELSAAFRHPPCHGRTQAPRSALALVRRWAVRRVSGRSFGRPPRLWLSARGDSRGLRTTKRAPERWGEGCMLVRDRVEGLSTAMGRWVRPWGCLVAAAPEW